MPSTAHNLRKAAVFIRSLDADTAAKLLAQLAPEEAHQVRAAIRTLGELDPEEQADVAAEFRRAAPLVNQSASQGVELQLTSVGSDSAPPLSRLQPGVKRFEFLEQAPVDALAQFLGREHVQTTAVVLSYLAPQRAAAVLAALPAPLQAETVERLSTLGETDPDSLAVVERELSAWVATRTPGRRRGAQRGDTVVSILAAADANTRDRILDTLKTHKAPLAKQLAPLLPTPPRRKATRAEPVTRRNSQADGLNRDWPAQIPAIPPSAAPCRVPPARRSSASSDFGELSRVVEPSAPKSAPCLAFDDLVLLSASELAAVLRDVDASVLVLALAGSRDELVDRICDQMPRRAAKAFRRQLGRLGPTRLSDVEAAQRIVAAAAARRLADRRPRTTQWVPGVEACGELSRAAPPSPQCANKLGAR